MMRVFTRDECVMCDRTKALAVREKLPFTEEPIDTPENLALAKKLKITSAPMVIYKGDAWGGFRPDKIMAISRRVNAGR